MADKKMEKALYGPSLTEVALGAVLGLLAGVLAACVFLIFKPVSLVKEMPKEPLRGTVYYIPGGESNAKSRTWGAKQKQFIAGTNIVLGEEELNAWAASAFAGAPPPRAPAPKPGAKPEEPKSAVPLNGIFNPGTPNFKISGGKLQIGLKCILNWYGLTKEVTILTTGDLVKSGDKFTYTARTFYLGSCPLHLLPAAVGPLVTTLIDKKPASDEINSAWAKLTEVALEGNTLKLTAK